jgi:hypothetical protein
MHAGVSTSKYGEEHGQELPICILLFDGSQAKHDVLLGPLHIKHV